MLPDRVSNPEPLTYESGTQPIALRRPAYERKNVQTNPHPYLSQAQYALALL